MAHPAARKRSRCAPRPNVCPAASLVAAPHVAQVEAAAGAVAEHHHAHAVRDRVAREALEAVGGWGGAGRGGAGARQDLPGQQAAAGYKARPPSKQRPRCNARAGGLPLNTPEAPPQNSGPAHAVPSSFT
jgi:hypothetical protein